LVGTLRLVLGLASDDGLPSDITVLYLVKQPRKKPPAVARQKGDKLPATQPRLRAAPCTLTLFA